MRLNLKLAIPVFAAVLAGGYYFVAQNAGNKPEPQTTAGAPLVQVKVPELSGSAKIGEQIFNAKCAACHGKNAAGRAGMGPPFIHKVYEPNHHADMAFMLAPRQGVTAHHWPFGNMPPVEGLTDGDIKLIIDYVRTLQRANGIG